MKGIHEILLRTDHFQSSPTGTAKFHALRIFNLAFGLFIFVPLKPIDTHKGDANPDSQGRQFVTEYTTFPEEIDLPILGGYP
jgi:hypothetical protein